MFSQGLGAAALLEALGLVEVDAGAPPRARLRLSEGLTPPRLERPERAARATLPRAGLTAAVVALAVAAGLVTVVVALTGALEIVLLALTALPFLPLPLAGEGLA